MPRKKKTTAVVISQKKIAEQIYDLRLETDLAQEAHSGQFVAVYPKNAGTLLPRPISICEADKEQNRLRLVYRIAGKGTTEFSGWKAGDEIALLGVLGNGFPLEKAEGRKVCLIGGGIGIPPMVQLAKELSVKELTGEKQIILGYRDSELFLREDLERYGRVCIATEDGSVGSRGNVLHAIRENHLEADVIMACGPMPMLRALKQYAEENGIEAYISLEERMACGVGACLGCVCSTKKVDCHSNVHHARICTDGPVFEAKEVDI